MINDEADEVAKKFDSLKNRYHNNLELMKGSQFFFNCVHLMYYKYHEINRIVVDHIQILLIA